MDKHGILNSWLEVFSPTVMGCLTDDYTTVDYDKWETWCRETANAGGNGIRILPYSPWNYPSGAVPIERLFNPYLLDQMSGKWNLDRWNNVWFLALGEMVRIADLYNLKIWLALFDNCQTHHGCERVAPWWTNIQGVRGYYDDLPRALKFANEVVDLVGNRINYELINEGEERGNMVGAVKWNVAVFDKLIAKGIKPETICWGALPSTIYEGGKFEQDRPHDLAQQILSITERRDREQSNKVYRAMHGVGTANEVVNGEAFLASYCGEWALQWWGKGHSGKGFVSDDGVGNGNNKLDHLPNGNYQRPDAAEWYIVAKEFFENDGGKNGKWIVERLPQNIDPAVWIPTLMAISRAYKKIYGTWPENYAKFPKPEPVPEPVEPEPIPAPQFCTIWYHLKRLNFKAAWEHLMGNHR